MHLIGFLIVGVAIGALASYVMTGPGYGMFWDMVVGAVGAMVAGLVRTLIFGRLDNGLLISYMAAVICAAVLVAILHLTGTRDKRTPAP